MHSKISSAKLRQFCPGFSVIPGTNMTEANLRIDAGVDLVIIGLKYGLSLFCDSSWSEPLTTYCKFRLLDNKVIKS